jgi:hypothetical protein
VDDPKDPVEGAVDDVEQFLDPDPTDLEDERPVGADFAADVDPTDPDPDPRPDEDRRR